jgi:glutamine amidotransferase
VIAIIDYGAGNVTSVKKALDWLGQRALLTSDVEEIGRADRLIVPGVGHFAATRHLTRSPLRAAIQAAIHRGVPFLGICLGMQWMFVSSREAPEVPGLGVFAGEASLFPPEVKSPHVGWNQLHPVSSSRLLDGISGDAFVYFTHSYRLPVVAATVATCEYGGPFSAVVESHNMFGVQFHPEKSGPVGIHLLETFCKLPC